MSPKRFLLLFNSVLTISYAFVFFLPVAILGWEWTLGYWKDHWPWLVAVGALLGLSWFLYGWSGEYHSFVVNEDWEGLWRALDARLRGGRPFGTTEVRLWVLASFLTRRIDRVTELERVLRVSRPGLWIREGLLFTTPFWLQRDFEGAEKRLAELLALGARVRNRDWVRWCLALLRSQRGDTQEVADLLKPALRKRDFPALFAAFLLHRISGDSPEIAAVRRRWGRISEPRLRERWKRDRERVLFTLFLEGVFEECVAWSKHPGYRSDRGGDFKDQQPKMEGP